MRTSPVVILIALCLGAGVGFVGHELLSADAAADRPAGAAVAQARVQPRQIEPCSRPATLTADVPIEERNPLVIRLVRTDGELHEHVVPVTPSAMESLDVGLAVPTHYSAAHAPVPVKIEGPHVVRVEQGNKVLALGEVTVVPEDPATPTTCHSGA